MSNWKNDHGKTKYPSLFIPFNEIDDKSNSVPIRIGYSTLNITTEYTDSVLTNDHLSFNGVVSIANTGRYSFGNPMPPETATSRHDLILSPHLHVGKHILSSFQVKFGDLDLRRNIYFINYYLSTGGLLLDVNPRTGQIWVGIKENGPNTVSKSTSTGFAKPNIWQHYFIDMYIESETKIIIKIWLTGSNGELLNSGESILIPASSEFNVSPPNLSVNGQSLIAREGGISFDIKNWVSLVIDSDPKPIVNELKNWYKNSSNDFAFPDFLRDIPNTISQRKISNYISTWSIDGSPGKTISSMYSFWKKYGVQNSVFEGISLSLGIAAFQSSAGVYKINELSDFADWCHAQNIKLKVMINDQTYNQVSDIPTYFPYWSKHYIHDGSLKEARAATYWDSIDSFDVNNEIFNNPNWFLYDSSKENSGTYRWFHHVWMIVNTLKDKPAFSGVTTGETSGAAIGNRDRDEANVAGQFNRAGIYGITNSSGVYQIEKIYSMRKQRVYFAKIMQMVENQLAHRADVMKSIQLNFIRSAMGGAPIKPIYDKPTKTFSMPIIPGEDRKTHGYDNGDAMFLWEGSWNAEEYGLQYDFCYYVTKIDNFNFKLSETPSGVPIDLVANIPTGKDVYFCPIYQWQELMIDKARDPYVINGLVLSDQTREFRLLAEHMHQYGFVTSGPDIFASGLEKPTYYVGPYIDNRPGTWSIVRLRLDMQFGRGIFSDIGLGGTSEIQSQDSTFGKEKDIYYTEILPFYGSWFNAPDGERTSVSQAVTYARERLIVNDIVWTYAQLYPQKSLPDLIKAISSEL